MSAADLSYQIDRGAVLIPPKPELMRDGFLRAFVRMARVADLVYACQDGREIIQQVPEEVLFNKDSVDSFLTLPISLLHPQERIIPGNATKYMQGAVGHEPVRVGDSLCAIATIYAKDSIDALLSGKAQEASCGYDAKKVFVRDGVLRQTERWGNHVAIVPQGRAGEDIRFVLDGADQLTTEYWFQKDAPEPFDLESDIMRDVLKELRPKRYYDFGGSNASQAAQSLPTVTSDSDAAEIVLQKGGASDGSATHQHTGVTPVHKFHLDGFEFETDNMDLAKHAKTVDAELLKARAAIEATQNRDAFEICLGGQRYMVSDDLATRIRALEEEVEASGEKLESIGYMSIEDAATALVDLKEKSTTLETELAEAKGKILGMEATNTDAAAVDLNADEVASRMAAWAEVLPVIQLDSPDYKPNYSLDASGIREEYLLKAKGINLDSAPADAVVRKAFIDGVYQGLKPTGKETASASNVDDLFTQISQAEMNQDAFGKKGDEKMMSREEMRKKQADRFAANSKKGGKA